MPRLGGSVRPNAWRRIPKLCLPGRRPCATPGRRLADALTGAGLEVWFDQSELRGGDAWDQKIRRQIKECALFVPVISGSTQARSEGYFRREWRLAVERTHDMADHVAFLLPLAAGGVDEAQAHVPEAFRDVQWIRMPADGGLPASLVDTVRSLLRTGSAAQAPAPDHPAARPVQPAAADPKSLAVLAFANRSDDRENEYFSDGISEELINALAKVAGLKVCARTSSFHFKGKDTPISEIARLLGVAYVVEGSVRKVGERVRITAQLIKAADGFHAWSDTFTRDLKDIFAVQDEIAGLIAGNLALKLGTTGPAATVDPEAYELFLKGRQVFNRSYSDYAKAISLYEAALAIDNTLAPAWAAASMAYAVRAGMSSHKNPAAGFEEARTAAVRAIALDPNLAAGHETLGTVQFAYLYDWPGAADSLGRATALAPGDGRTTSLLSTIAQIVGRRERALELGRRAVELDPLNSLVGYVYGKALFQAGLFTELERFGGQMVSTNPGAVYGYTFQVYARLFLGRLQEAADAAVTVPDGFFRDICKVHTLYALGKRQEGDSVFEKARKDHAASGAYQIAEAYAHLGEVDAAFEWLDTSYRQRDPGMTWLMNDAFMAKIRPDPRWDAVMRRMKLAEDQIREHPSLMEF